MPLAITAASYFSMVGLLKALQIASRWGRRWIDKVAVQHGAAMDADEPESLVGLWNGDHGVPEMWEHA
ncbi:hypothetical protein B0H13DRAFT_2302364 [Mycena leptocephala]|nr:hypothetical protein B0H13DRAFT_2302364 [Mycena leptocephala]